MKIGDRVLAINGINVGGATLQDAYNLMKQCRGTTLFLVEYDVAIVGRWFVDSFSSLCSTIRTERKEKY